MKIDIRENIIHNFKGADFDEIKNSIENSITTSDEVTLPGLGVFFEILWNNSDENSKKYIIDTIKKSL